MAKKRTQGQITVYKAYGIYYLGQQLID